MAIVFMLVIRNSAWYDYIDLDSEKWEKPAVKGPGKTPVIM